MSDRFRNINKVINYRNKIRNLQEDVNKTEPACCQAKQYIKNSFPVVFINSNLYVVYCYSNNPPINYLKILDRDCFIDNLSPQEQNRAYSAIKKHHKARLNYDETVCKELFHTRYIYYNFIHHNFNFNFNFCCTGSDLQGITTDCIKNPYIFDKPTFIYDNTLQSLHNICENIAPYLYDLTQGDIDVLEKLSMLCACVLSETLAINKPIVILADETIHTSIEKLLFTLANDRLSSIKFTELLKTEGRKSLLQAIQNNCFANILTDRLLDKSSSPIPESDASIAAIRNLISGKEISIKYENVPYNVTLKNTLPFIYITNSHENYLKMRNMYGAVGIKLPAKRGLPEFNDAEMAWFKTCFALGGLRLLNETNWTTHSVSKISEDDVFGAFARDVCIFSEDATCPKAEVYEAYEVYYKKLFGDKPLSKITFGKKFAIFKNLETVRPHNSRSKYPYCFKGICINQEKLYQLKNPYTEPYKMPFEEFKNYLYKTYPNPIIAAKNSSKPDSETNNTIVYNV